MNDLLKNRKLEIRGARSWKEHEIMVDNAATAFGIDRDSFYFMSKYSPGYRFEDTRLSLLDGEIIGALNILRRKVNIRGAIVDAGCIADVHIKKEYRGGGYALRLLEDAIAYMKSEGMVVSLLFSNKHGFYGKLGWRRIIMSKYVLEAETEMFPVPDRYRVRRIGLGESIELLRKICEETKDENSGQVHRDASYWRSVPKWCFVREPICYAALEDEEVVAVCMLRKKFGTIWMHECRNLPGHDESPKNLLREALKEAKKRRLDSVTGMLPETSPVAVKIILLGGRREFNTDLMGLILDPKSLMEKMTPYLRRKVKEKTLYKKVKETVVVPGIGSFEIVIRNAKLEKTGSGTRKAGIEIDSGDFINMLFGTPRFSGCISGGVEDLVNDLLEPDDFNFWQMDRF
ncbi:GNAT family N-acetyltransferase [bacterium]